MIFQLLPLLVKNPILFFISLALIVLPLLISITIHEWSHGFVAYKFGDPTPKIQGRLSLNPFAHLDPIGTLMLFIVGIGWAKPVEINPQNIPGKTKQMLVALAGPASNFILAVLLSFIVYGIAQYMQINNIQPGNSLWGLIAALLRIVIQINIILGIFNMLPIPPLDGSNILKWVMPESLANAYSRLAPFGMIILIIILFTAGFSFIFTAASAVEKLIYNAIDYILSPIF